MLTLPLVALAGPPDKAQETTAEHMQQHFEAGTDTVWAICRGDVEAAKAAVEGLDHLKSDFPVTWQPRLTSMRKAARRVSLASSPSSAAAHMSGVVSACASCHESVVGGPQLTPDKQRVDDATANGDHQRTWHYLWLSLAFDDSVLWNNTTRPMGPTPEHPKTSAQAEAYTALGEQARNAATPQDRRFVYRQIISSCAACHQAAGVTLPAEPPAAPE